jgi:hypothetical protein
MISSRELTYRSVLREVSNWPSKTQLQLIQDIANLLKMPTVDTLESVDEEAAWLEKLQLSVAGKKYIPPRQYRADEVAGIIEVSSLLIEDETELLTQALLEKYG